MTLGGQFMNQDEGFFSPNIDAVLSDDRLNQSEVIYSFLSPSPSYLKSGIHKQFSIDEDFNSRSSEQRFTFTNIFKSSSEKPECSEEGGGRRLKWMESKKTPQTEQNQEDVLDDFDTPDVGTVG